MKLPFWWLLLLLTVGALLFVITTNAANAERSADNWFALLASIETDLAEADAKGRKIPNITREERRFIRKMANELSASAEAKPTPMQGQWLLSIRAWIDESQEKD
jgi:hypothetical protein